MSPAFEIITQRHYKKSLSSLPRQLLTVFHNCYLYSSILKTATQNNRHLLCLSSAASQKSQVPPGTQACTCREKSPQMLPPRTNILSGAIVSTRIQFC